MFGVSAFPSNSIALTRPHCDASSPGCLCRIDGASAKALQTTLASLAQSMKNEVREVIAASGETANSQQAVRRLTEHIGKLTDSAQRSAGANDQLHERTSKINGMVQLIKEVADQTNLLVLNAAIEALLGNARHMTGTIAGSALRSFIETAKTDHLIFKMEIYRVFFGVSSKQDTDFASHHACRLGKWYFEGDGRDCFSKLPGYAEIDPYHKQVHEHGQRAVRAFHAGNLVAGVEEIAAMEQASMGVIEHLERMAVAGENSPEVLCVADV